MASTSRRPARPGSRRRNLILGGAAGAGIAAIGWATFKTMPSFFWKQLRDDLTRVIPAATERPNPAQWPETGLHAAWLGHSTVLLKMDGVTVLTDPVLLDWVGVDLRVATVGMKRLVAPALFPDELPPIDLILSSHAHMDHLDLATMRLLESPRTEVVMARATSDLVRTARYRGVQEAGWGQEVQTRSGVRIRGLEVKHWGARMRTDTHRGYGGYLIEYGRWRVLFGGDTAETDAFRRQRSAAAHLALMPVGAYDPWIYAHCTPEQAWRMTNDFGAEYLLPIHHSTFQLSREPRSEPLERTLTAAGNREERIVARAIGSEFHLS